MRIDYCYRRNGTRGYVQTLSVSRAPADCKLYAYTAARIATRAPFASEFAAVTDVPLLRENERHRFVLDTLLDAGIETIGMDHFATWVPKVKATMLTGDSHRRAEQLGHTRILVRRALRANGENHEGGIVLPAASAERGYRGQYLRL